MSADSLPLEGPAHDGGQHVCVLDGHAPVVARDCGAAWRKKPEDFDRASFSSLVIEAPAEVASNLPVAASLSSGACCLRCGRPTLVHDLACGCVAREHKDPNSIDHNVHQWHHAGETVPLDQLLARQGDGASNMRIQCAIGDVRAAMQGFPTSTDQEKPKHWKQ